ncbi:MAG: hypothetical protein Q9M31_01835 [Mariprofundus sp.]|nr:hypothetical protein [Mariprofundus sp.]
MIQCYSIDALSASGDKAWRLQLDDSWRVAVYGEALQENDARITDNGKAEFWVGRRLKKDNKLGLTPQKKAGKFDFFMRGVFSHIVIHHLQQVSLPERTQMEACIASLVPGSPWLLYLDTAAHFQAVDSATTAIIGNLEIAVRGEIASSPDYVGITAVENQARMEVTYRQFLAGWLEHLNTSKMNLFIPDVEKLKEEVEYIEAIGSWRPETM